MVVGGTGQYVNALVQGWQAPRVPPDPALRERIEALIAQEGVEAAAQELRETDPDAAARIDLRNPRRVVRALEVAAALGPGAHGGQSPPPYRSLVLGLTTSTREELYERIDGRVDAMLAGGWLDEVRALLDAGYSAELPSLSSMGYRELAQHVLGELPLEEAARRIKLAHHRLARQQYTWFKPTDATHPVARGRRGRRGAGGARGGGVGGGQVSLSLPAHTMNRSPQAVQNEAVGRFSVRHCPHMSGSPRRRTRRPQLVQKFASTLLSPLHSSHANSGALRRSR